MGLILRALQCFFDSTFILMKVSLNFPDCTCISKHAQSINVPFKNPPQGEITHLVIDLSPISKARY
ncbi:MAG: hypothetical protein G5663_01245 [Serratia symbiotica]|nr:hypothetical protein [Serratia symbiotica]